VRLERYYQQDITYWAPGPEDGYGAPTFSDPPVQFLGRWEESSQMVVGPKGEVVQTNSLVNYPQELSLVESGYLALGKFFDLNPRLVTGARKILFLSEIPDLRALVIAKVAML